MVWATPRTALRSFIWLSAALSACSWWMEISAGPARPRGRPSRHHPHGPQRAHHGRVELALIVEAGLVVDAAVVGRLTTGLGMRLTEIELVLEGGLDADTAIGGALDDVLEEGARAGAVALAVLLDQVAVHAGVLGHPGQDGEGLPIRHQAQLADEDMLDRDDRVDQRERHLSGGQVDAVAEAVGQVVDRGHLATLHAGEVAVDEADQLDACGAGAIEDVLAFTVSLLYTVSEFS